MSNSDNLKNSIKETSRNLAKLGTELAEIKFSYKVEEKSSKDYWEKRMNEFINHNDKSLEYYNQVHTMMNLINKEESQMFLLSISKFRQLGLGLLEIMQKIKDNPSITDPKDKQQSQWSKEIKNNLNEQSNKCLNHEREMNKTFRDFYQNQLKQILDS
jgi:hypothetical protein